MPKRSSFKNWNGRDEEEDPGEDGKRKEKEIVMCWSEKMERVDDR